MSDASNGSDEQLAFILIGNKADLSAQTNEACPCEKLLKEWCN